MNHQVGGTTSELARRLGVTAKSVTSAIERGDIRPERYVTSPTGRRAFVDLEGAVADYRAAVLRGVAKGPQAASKRELPTLPQGVDPFALGDGLMPPAGIDLNTARTIREWWAALDERADYERKAGTLVAREDVKRDAFTVFRATRDALLALPERMAQDLAAEPDPARVFDRLRSEVNRILDDLSVGLGAVSGVDLV